MDTVTSLAAALREWSHRDLPPPPEPAALAARLLAGEAVRLDGRSAPAAAALANLPTRSVVGVGE